MEFSGESESPQPDIFPESVLLLAETGAPGGVGEHLDQLDGLIWQRLPLKSVVWNAKRMATEAAGLELAEG